MSFLNGIGGLLSGVGAFAGNAAADAKPAPPDSVPARVESTPADTPPPAAAPPAAAAPTPAPAAPATKAAVPAGVPPELLPIYESAAKRTGIPVAVLIAQGKQESGFNPNEVSSTGAIGIHQILPSTATSPGYGVKPVDPSTLKNAAVNINFAADYLRARAGLGADFNHPATVDAALRAYNGAGSPGSDPRYVENVRRYMGNS